MTTDRTQPQRGRVLGAALLLVAIAGPFFPSTARPGPPPLAAGVRGSGNPTLVLIHSLGQDRTVWNRLASRLEGRYRLVIVDLPGHGRSASIPDVSVASVTEALDRTLRERKVKQALLVGHSYGGLVALEEAAKHPDRAAGVVTIETETYANVDSERVANLEQIMAQRYPLFIRGVFESMTRDSSEVDSVVAKAGLVPRDVLAEYFRDAWRADIRPSIRSLKAPIMVVAIDTTWPPQESWTSARKRFGYETAGPAIGRRIWGAAHLVQLDQPDTLAAAISEFAETLKK
ncbi:MAG TPA: alpha/beta hydrolase [Candidatus Eisenbacteria bacterium]|nr:alpha/beta hydrolase [Candidatus Eisenbacteria bacterium]